MLGNGGRCAVPLLTPVSSTGEPSHFLAANVFPPLLAKFHIARAKSIKTLSLAKRFFLFS